MLLCLLPAFCTFPGTGGGVGATELGATAGAIVAGVVAEVEGWSGSFSIGTSYNGRHMQVGPR